MLPDWYFCCCIGAEPESTSAFLSILETLENPESDNLLLYTAYDELMRTDTWMQIYALPQVLGSLPWRGSFGDRDGALSEYFAGLLGMIPEKVQPAFSALVNSLLLKDAPASAIIDLVEVCAGKKMPPREPSQKPYLDLQEFLPEIFLLSVLADRYAVDESFAPEILNKLEAEASPLRQLLHGAVEYAYGRLAFRLAAGLGRLISSAYTSERILTKIWTLEHSAAIFEPDLLHMSARVLFLYDIVNPSQEQAALICTKEILPEIWRLTHLREYSALIPEDKRKSDAVPLQTVNLGAIGGREILLPVIYWQAILWDLSSRVSPSATAEEIEQTWHPPQLRVKKVDPIEVTSNDWREVSHWQEQLAALLQLLDSEKAKFTNQFSLTVRAKSRVFFPVWFKWVFLTPWVWRGPIGIRYPAVQRFEALIRLAACVPVVARLLQKLPADSPQVAQAASTLVHAADVLTTAMRYHDRSNRPGDTRYAEYKFSPRQKGLIEFGIRQAKLIGTGRLESVPPRTFTSLLQVAQEPDRKTSIGFNQREVFENLVLPKMILEWVADAYAASPVQSGPRRWLHPDLIAEVYVLYRDHSEKEELPEKVRGALLARFFCESSQVVTDPSLDWKTAFHKRGKETIPLKWEVKGRHFLLTEPGLPPSEWVGNRAGWEEPEDWSDDKYDPSAPLIRSLERLASLQNGDDVPQETREKWEREWVEYLNAVNDPDKSDRYVRLRLLELLYSEVLKGSQAGQELISLFILEYGSAYDLKLLFDLIFDLGREPVSSEVRRKLQETLLGAMHRGLKRDTADIDYRRRRFAAQDPRYTIDGFMKAKLVGETLGRIAALYYFDRDNKRYRQWGQTLSDLRQHSLKDDASNTWRRVKANVEISDGQKRLVLPEGHAEVAEWAIRGAVYDPNLMTMSLLYEDYDLSATQYDLFKEPALFETKFREHETNRVLAVFVTAEPSKREGNVTYVFNCGLTRYAKVDRHNGWPCEFAPGEFVSLPVQRRRVGDSEHFYPYISPDSSIDRLLPRIRPGDARAVMVTESWQEKRYPPRKLTIRMGGWDITQEAHLHSFDPDASRCFDERAATDGGPIFAKFGSDEKWHPVDFTLFDLIISSFVDGAESATVLTLVDELTTVNGERAWRFSRRPGENYLLTSGQFVSEDALQLEQEIDGMDDPYGLLVSVTLESRDDRVFLKLCRETRAGEGPIVASRRGIKVPFDHRNAEWRDLFRKETNRIAMKVGERKWEVELEEGEALGYPRHVRVFWNSRYQPDPDDKRMELSPWEWKARYPFAGYSEKYPFPVVWGDALKPHELLIEGRRWPDLLDEWLSLRVERVSLVSILGTVRPGYEGYIDCLTSENFRVWVEIESLTMRRIPVGGKPFMPEFREAEVIWANWISLKGT